MSCSRYLWPCLLFWVIFVVILRGVFLHLYLMKGFEVYPRSVGLAHCNWISNTFMNSRKTITLSPGKRCEYTIILCTTVRNSSPYNLDPSLKNPSLSDRRKMMSRDQRSMQIQKKMVECWSHRTWLHFRIQDQLGSSAKGSGYSLRVCGLEARI